MLDVHPSTLKSSKSIVISHLDRGGFLIENDHFLGHDNIVPLPLSLYKTPNSYRSTQIEQ
jgi:hypothetical protein